MEWSKRETWNCRRMGEGRQQVKRKHLHSYSVPQATGPELDVAVVGWGAEGGRELGAWNEAMVQEPFPLQPDLSHHRWNY